MSNEKKNSLKKGVHPTPAELKKLQEDEAIRLSILHNTDKGNVDKGSDVSLDKINLRKLLLKYREFNPKRKYIRNELRKYAKRFPKEFYEEICRLNGWPMELALKRPSIVGQWTNEIIYYRFPNGILQLLREKNPYIKKGQREFKHFQWLTDIGDKELMQFIYQAISLMQKSSNWYEFRRSLSIEMKAPYVGDLFIDK